MTVEESVQDSLAGGGCAQIICDHTRPKKSRFLSFFPVTEPRIRVEKIVSLVLLLNLYL